MAESLVLETLKACAEGPLAHVAYVSFDEMLAIDCFMDTTLFAFKVP